MQGTIRHNYQANLRRNLWNALEKYRVEMRSLLLRCSFCFQRFQICGDQFVDVAATGEWDDASKVFGDCQAIRLRFCKHVLKHHLIWRETFAHALSRTCSPL